MIAAVIVSQRGGHKGNGSVRGGAHTELALVVGAIQVDHLHVDLRLLRRVQALCRGFRNRLLTSPPCNTVFAHMTKGYCDGRDFVFSEQATPYPEFMRIFSPSTACRVITSTCSSAGHR